MSFLHIIDWSRLRKAQHFNATTTSLLLREDGGDR